MFKVIINNKFSNYNLSMQEKMDSLEIKNNLLELLYTNETEQLIKNLKKLSNNKNIYEGKSEEYFKYVWKARSCGGKSYYASNIGRVILTDRIYSKEKISIKYLKKQNQKYYNVVIENGYLTTKGLPEDWKIALHTDVYKFVKEAFKEEFLEEINKLKKYFPNEKLELHHINNNPDDNRLSNLIYLPKSLHVYAH